MLKTLVSHFTTNPSGCVRSVAAIDLFGMRQSEMFSWVFGRVRCAVQQTFLIPISLQSIRQTKEPGSLCQLVVEELATLHPLRCLSLANRHRRRRRHGPPPFEPDDAGDDPGEGAESEIRTNDPTVDATPAGSMQHQRRHGQPGQDNRRVMWMGRQVETSKLIRLRRWQQRFSGWPTTDERNGDCKLI